uniref:Uncharacterized protein n=1 Tax=Panagrolaimus sp. PS1159 TaxID=55785 RepID=A0AC35GNF1_9BILA
MEELLKNVNEAETVEAKVKLFEDFTNKYTILPMIWREWTRIVNANAPVEEQKNNKKKLWIKALSHFYSKGFANDIYQISDGFKRDLIRNKIFYRQVEWGIKGVKPLLYYLQYVKKSLSLPNDKLKDYMEFYEEFSTKPIPPEIYQIQQKSRMLFDFGSVETALKLMKDFFGKDITENELKDELNLMEPNEVEPTIPDYAIDEIGFAPFRTTKAVPLKLNEKQTFAFPSKLLFYILQKSDSKMFQKLHSSSK